MPDSLSEIVLGELLAIIATEASEHPYEGSRTQKEAWDEIKRRHDALVGRVRELKDALRRIWLHGERIDRIEYLRLMQQDDPLAAAIEARLAASGEGRE